MIRKILYFTILTVGALILLYSLTYAQGASSKDLIQNAEAYDGKLVVYKGEIIGEIMRRGDYAWINLLDGENDNAIGVWVPGTLIKDIGYTGSYKSIGDEIEVTGIFHRSCSEHGGDLDIHAQAIIRTAAGRCAAERLNTEKRNYASILLGLLFLIWILTLLKRK
jgi:hypothetical protein